MHIGCLASDVPMPGNDTVVALMRLYVLLLGD